MFIKYLIAPAALAFFVTSGAVSAADVRPFGDKTIVAPHVHVESGAQFAKWSGKPVPLGAYDSSFYERARLGTIALSPDLRVHLDLIRRKVAIPSYYELVDSSSGKTLGKYVVVEPEDGEWYFSGNGTAYLNQSHMQLCESRYTRKIAQKGRRLIDVNQPIEYVGAETEVDTTTQLYESPTSRSVVATVVAGSQVNVIGVLPGKTEWPDIALLVRTPLGLTGWHVPNESGSLKIYQCN